MQKEILGADQRTTTGLNAPLVLELNQGKYRDEKFYLNHLPRDHITEASLHVHGDSKSQIASAVMDLMGEDQSTLMKSKRRFHWVSFHRNTWSASFVLVYNFQEFETMYQFGCDPT